MLASFWSVADMWTDMLMNQNLSASLISQAVIETAVVERGIESYAFPEKKHEICEKYIMVISYPILFSDATS